MITLAGFWAGFAVISHRDDDRELPWDRLTIALLDKERSRSPIVPLYSADAHLQYRNRSVKTLSSREKRLGRPPSPVATDFSLDIAISGGSIWACRTNSSLVSPEF